MPTKGPYAKFLSKVNWLSDYFFLNLQTGMNEMVFDNKSLSGTPLVERSFFDNQVLTIFVLVTTLTYVRSLNLKI